jgi:hypothetical protein
MQYFEANGLGSESLPEVTNMVYNAARQWVKKLSESDTTNFLYDMKKLLQETDGDDDPTTRYTTAEGEYGNLISEYDEDAEGGPAEDRKRGQDSFEIGKGIGKGDRIRLYQYNRI